MSIRKTSYGDELPDEEGVPILLTAHQDVVPTQEEVGDLDPWETPTSVLHGIDAVFQKLFGSIIPEADKIDVHHHWVPPVYADAIGVEGDPSGWPRPHWSLESSEELMKRAGIKKSILSITAPGACILKGKQSWDLARTLNTKAAEIRDSKPDSFGFFLTLGNILDTDEALAEIAYGFDKLKADGVCLFTRYDSDDNFGDPNKYLGHREFEPIWNELNRRKAVVFVHPTHPRDTSRASFLLYQPIVDYPHETTRAAMDMLLSGTRSQFPDCQVILSHAGGTLPYLIPRVEALLVSGHHQHIGPVLIPTERILRDYRSFHFDIALSTSNATIKTLLETGVPKENILFGSDFPYAPESAYPAFLQHWQEADISSEQRRQVHYENAQKVFGKSKGPQSQSEEGEDKKDYYFGTVRMGGEFG